jgi:autotransporter translocation and assembly factor TamB
VQGEPVAVDLSLTASLENDLLVFETKGNGGDAFSLAAQGQLPVRVSTAPIEFSVNSGGAIEGTFEMLGDVAVVEQMVPVDPHRLRGTLRAQAAVAGTIANPVITGEAMLPTAPTKMSKSVRCSTASPLQLRSLTVARMCVRQRRTAHRDSSN